MKFSVIDAPYLVAGSIPFDAKDFRSLQRQGVGAIVSREKRSVDVQLKQHRGIY